MMTWWKSVCTDRSLDPEIDFGEDQSVQWCAQKPFDDDLPEHRKRIQNGFVTLTFTENEAVETYYHQNGDSVEI